MKQKTKKSKINLFLLAAVFIMLFEGIALLELRHRVSVKPLQGMTIILAGDSRSSTDYSFYKEILEQKSGAAVLVEGASGRNAAFNASDEYFLRIENNPHNFSVWLVGGNDTGETGSIGTFSADSPLGRIGESVVPETDISEDYNGEKFIQAVDHMMRKYKNSTYNYKETGRVTRMIFCTDIPQQRDSLYSPWSLRENWERKRLAILECCEKNGIPCLDLYQLCGFDMSFEPIYSAPTDIVHDRGLYYMDGLHLNRRGVDLITNFEVELMKRYTYNE